MVDVLVDAILDTLKLLPFLFILYILIEILEHRTQIGRPLKALNGRRARRGSGNGTYSALRYFSNGGETL